jgi:hypothetical protein
MEQPTIRDAVAVFDNAERLENAVSELQSNGIDRSELSLVAHASHTGRIPGIFGRPPTIRPHSANRLSAIPSCGRDGCSVLDSRRPSQQRLWREAASPPPARYSAANWLTDQRSFLDAQLAHGGILLWVRTHDAASERNVPDVLRRYSAQVYVHDLPSEATALDRRRF